MAVPISTATQAVDALLKWKASQSNSQNPQLLPIDDFVYLILTLKKIPTKGGINGARTNPHKIPLPHPLIPPSSFPELCLIIDDRPTSKLTSQIAKKKIKTEGIPVTKVIKLSKLKTDYRSFESKRKLCDSYEMFFADKRVIPLLPKLLGKWFFKKKKSPLPVDLSHKNWKEQIERGCFSGLLFLNTGTCCVVRVAKGSMERDEIVENLSAAIDGAVGFVPKKLLGVRSLHLKFSESVALPLYQSLPDIKLRIEGVKENNVNVNVNVEGVVEEKEVGNKKGSKTKKGRIHEVNHDEGESIESIENDDPGSVELVVKKKKGESDVEKLAKKSGKRVHDGKEDERIENDDPGSVELVGRKKKGESNVEKPAKKSGKRVHEDEKEDERIENDDPGSVELVGRKRKGESNVEKLAKKSGKRVHEDEKEDVRIENDDPGSVELVGRKRKVGLNVAKPAKKSGKAKHGAKDDSVELVNKKRKVGLNVAKPAKKSGKAKNGAKDDSVSGKKKTKKDAVEESDVTKKKRRNKSTKL